VKLLVIDDLPYQLGKALEGELGALLVARLEQVEREYLLQKLHDPGETKDSIRGFSLAIRQLISDISDAVKYKADMDQQAKQERDAIENPEPAPVRRFVPGLRGA
jgi:hypothetical protein